METDAKISFFMKKLNKKKINPKEPILCWPKSKFGIKLVQKIIRWNETFVCDETIGSKRVAFIQKENSKRERNYWRWWDSPISMRLRRSTAFTYSIYNRSLPKWHSQSKKKERKKFPLWVVQITFVDSIVQVQCMLEETQQTIEQARQKAGNLCTVLCIASAFYRNRLICVLCDFVNDLWFPVFILLSSVCRSVVVVVVAFNRVNQIGGLDLCKLITAKI